MEIEKLIDELRIAGAGNPGNIFDEAANALEQLKRERDAAVADLNELRKRTERECACCYYLDNYDRDICCGCEHSNYNLWEWRGVQKEENT